MKVRRSPKPYVFLTALTVISVVLSGCLVPAAGSRESSPVVQRDYSRQEKEYFMEIALGAEYGSSDSSIHKWDDDIRIKVKGSPTDEDMETLEDVIEELDRLTTGITLETVFWNPDIKIHFASVDRFVFIEPNYVPGNMGFFWAWWDGTGELYKARILIARDRITQEERSHLIREELTQCLGMMNDSGRFEESIFYQGWTDVQDYAEIDRAVISILYDPRIRPGMDRQEVEDILY